MKGLLDLTVTSKKNYWMECDKQKEPFILIREKGEKYVELFFDVTHMNINIDALSDDLKKIYLSYINFFILPHSDVSEYLDQQYLFNILILREHLECFSEQLFAYLLKNKK